MSCGDSLLELVAFAPCSTVSGEEFELHCCWPAAEMAAAAAAAAIALVSIGSTMLLSDLAGCCCGIGMLCCR